MRTIIEMYDPSDPIYNVLIPSVMQPDQIVFFAQHDIIAQLQSFNRYFTHVLEGPALMRQIICDISDVAACVEVMNELIDEQDLMDECIIDVTGGNEALLMAVGIVCAKRPIDVVLYQHDTRQILHLWGNNSKHRGPMTYRVDIASRILLSGGECVGSNHVDAASLPDQVLRNIPGVFYVNMRHRKVWHHFSLVLQHLHKENHGNRLLLRGNPVYAGPNGIRHIIPTTVLQELKELGIVDGVCLSGTQCSFEILSELMLQRLCDTGSWLQLFIWHTLRNTAEFDDVGLNMRLVWRKDVEPVLNTVNEVDVLATIGATMFLISCKTGTPQMSALNEISTLTRKFGGVFAVPILATTSDLSAEAPAVMRRAHDMEVQVIDAVDLQSEDRLRRRLLQIAQEWNKYQEQLQW